MTLTCTFNEKPGQSIRFDFPSSLLFPEFFKAFEDKGIYDILDRSFSSAIENFLRNLKEKMEKHCSENNFTVSIDTFLEEEDVAIEFGLYTTIFNPALVIRCDNAAHHFIFESLEMIWGNPFTDKYNDWLEGSALGAWDALYIFSPAQLAAKKPILPSGLGGRCP